MKIQREEGRMKKLFATTAVSALVISLGMISGASAQAVDCKAFNKGTYTAFHVAGAEGAGLYKIAGQCHAG